MACGGKETEVLGQAGVRSPSRSQDRSVPRLQRVPTLQNDQEFVLGKSCSVFVVVVEDPLMQYGCYVDAVHFLELLVTSKAG